MDGLRLAPQRHVQEQAEALHDETKAHQAQHRAVPGEQGTFGGEEYARVLKVAHALYGSGIFGYVLILD